MNLKPGQAVQWKDPASGHTMTGTVIKFKGGGPHGTVLIRLPEGGAVNMTANHLKPAR